jgi:DNA-binding transcriptional MocR family regulator
MINNGDYEKNLKKIRVLYEKKLELMVYYLNENKFIKIINKPKGGFFILVKINEDLIDFDKLNKEFDSNKLIILFINKIYIRLCFTYLKLDEIDEGIKRFNECFFNSKKIDDKSNL